jgi:hypothetical protein
MGKENTEAAKVEAPKAETVECTYNAYTPCHFTHGNKEYNLVQGESYSLPNSPFAQSLAEQGRLTVKK